MNNENKPMALVENWKELKQLNKKIINVKGNMKLNMTSNLQIHKPFHMIE